MASIGEAIGLGNIARVERDRPLTNAVVRKQNLDLQDRAARAKQGEANKKRQEEMASMLQIKGGFLPYYQERAKKIASDAYSRMMASNDFGEKSAIAQQAKFDSENLMSENNQLVQNLQTARGKGLVPDKVFSIFNLPELQADKAYEEYKTTNPEIEEIVFRNQNGSLQFNPVEKVDIKGAYSKAVNDLKEGAVPMLDKNGNWVNEKMLDNTFRFKSIADPIALNQYAATLASDPNFGTNVRISQPKEYKAEFDRILAEQQKLGGEIDFDNLKLAATAAVIKKGIEPMAKYNDIKSKPEPNNFNFGFGSGGSFRTQSKWTITPAETDNKRPSLVEKLNAFNNKNNTNYTYEEFYKTGNNTTEKYDEAVFENQDVSENKAFQYTNEAGDLVNVIPISVRRRQAGGDWKLIGKVENPDYKAGDSRASEKYIDVELPYNNAVRQKTDAILQADTRAVLNKMFPNRKQAAPSNSGNKGKKIAVVGADGSVTYKVQ